MKITRRQFGSALGIGAAAGAVAYIGSVLRGTLSVFDGEVPEKDTVLRELVSHPEQIDFVEAAMGRPSLSVIGGENSKAQRLTQLQVKKVLAFLRRNCFGTLERQAMVYQPLPLYAESGVNAETAVLCFRPVDDTAFPWALDTFLTWDTEWDATYQIERTVNKKNHPALCISIPTTLFWEQDAVWQTLYPDGYIDSSFPRRNAAGSQDFIYVSDARLVIGCPREKALSMGDQIAAWLKDTVDTDAAVQRLARAAAAQRKDETDWAQGTFSFIDRPLVHDSITEPYTRSGVRCAWVDDARSTLYSLWLSDDGQVLLNGPWDFEADGSGYLSGRIFSVYTSAYR